MPLNHILAQTIQLRKQLHHTPELSLHETKTKQLLMQFLRAHTHSLEIVDRGAWFYAYKKGTGRLAPIAFRADYDAVTGADGRPHHLCGHDGHSAVLAGFGLCLEEEAVNRDVYLIFQPAEEIGQGALLCAPLLCEKHIGEIYAFHNIPGYPEKEILCLDRTFACASTGLEIRFSGRQSHAAYPENGANPAFAIAETIRSMHEIMSKRHRGIVLGTVIGIEAGSRAYGVSAGEGTLRLTLRAEYQEEYEAFVSKIEQTAKALAKDSGLSVAITRIEEFPATVNDKACVEKVRAAAKALGQTPVCPAEPFRWSEDFGYCLQQTKGAYFGIGCGTAYPALHTMAYEFEDDIIECALRLYHHLLRL